LKPQIADLIGLQIVDSSIQKEQAEIAALPGRVAAVDARIQEYKDKLEARNQEQEEAKKERRTLEGELQSINDKLSKYQDQLMQVKTNEAYTAMLKEIKGTKNDIVEHEEKILEDMLSVDDLSAEIKELEKQFQADKALLEKEKVEVEAAGLEAEKRLVQHQEERRLLTDALDDRALADYQRVHTMREGLAVVEVREELCLGCRVKVRPQVIEEVRAGELRQCDSCTRFLFVVEELTGEAANKPPEGEPPAEILPADASSPDTPPAEKPST
jgi:predicted  nucleic acid-binding Zn-ribbon protein